MDSLPQGRSTRVTLLFRFAAVLGPAVLAAAPGPARAVANDERQPSPIMSWRGADWLERAGRDEEERPEEILSTMELREGDVVADIGCGTGYFARRLARAVGPTGRVYAVDVQAEMIGLLEKRLAEEGLTNVVPLRGDNDDPKLPRGSLDWIILADVYHEFQQPKTMLARMREALRPDGKIALVEYRLDGTSALHIREDHRMSPRQVLSEWRPAGYSLVALHEFLPAQHLFIFEKTRER